ncbi:MAG: DUF4292 domain-containing protein [Ferruginibacter sp.]|nr:DUF4292 domain-containing protein [Ferruginibacter sp.]
MKLTNYSTGYVSAIIFATLIAFSAGGCKTAKKIQASIDKKDTTSVHITNTFKEDSMRVIKNAMMALQKKQIVFKTFSAKIKVEYEDAKGKQPNITAYVRILKDSLIWISGYATVFNIEAFRVLINKDSVFVLDKINKEVRLRSMDYLQEVTEIPFDLNTLQDLFVGNPVFLEDSVISYKETGSKILLATLGHFFKHLLTLNKDDGLLVHSKLDDVNLARNRTADITYADYENNNGVPFSTDRAITVSEKNKLDIHLNYKQYEFNKDLSITFNIPANYKRR